MHIEEDNINKTVLVTAVILLYLPVNDEVFLANLAGMVRIWYLAFI